MDSPSLEDISSSAKVYQWYNESDLILIPASFVPRYFTMADTSSGCLSHREYVNLHRNYSSLSSLSFFFFLSLSPLTGIPPLIDGRKEEGMLAHNVMRA